MTAPARTVFETVSFKLKYEWLVLLDEWCDFTGKSRSDILREAFRMYFVALRKEIIAAGLMDEHGNRIKKTSKKKGRK